MIAPNRPLHLTPRILLVFAVLACVFGWGHSSASAADDPGVAHEFAAAHADVPHAGAHADHASGSHAVDPSMRSPMSPQPAQQPAGHGHDHSATCMASSAAAAGGVLGVVLTPFLTGLPAVLPDLAEVNRADVAAHPPTRPPSITVLCVQRT